VDSLEQQLYKVSGQVEALHQEVQRMGGNMTELLASCRQAGETGSVGSNSLYQSFNQDLSAHKDVIDEGGSNFPERGQSISAELQVQRLTAQLTAAYGRIAALEEQLMAHRSPVHISAEQVRS
jgi:hypothetical protein